MWNTKATLVAAALAGLGIPVMHNWTADLTPMPGHRVSGTATFNGDTKDVVKVSLTLENAQPNSTVKWHVHKGACTETNAPIVGKESAYPAAQADGSGRVSTTVNVPGNLNESGYSVRVHEDSSNPSGKDYYKSQDSTMSRDTTMHQDKMYPRDTTKSQWPAKATSDKSEKLATAACGDLKPQTGEKANR
jgi:hypothetical protein